MTQLAQVWQLVSVTQLACITRWLEITQLAQMGQSVQMTQLALMTKWSEISWASCVFWWHEPFIPVATFGPVLWFQTIWWYEPVETFKPVATFGPVEGFQTKWWYNSVVSCEQLPHLGQLWFETIWWYEPDVSLKTIFLYELWYLRLFVGVSRLQHLGRVCDVGCWVIWPCCAIFLCGSFVLCQLDWPFGWFGSVTLDTGTSLVFC